MPALFGRAGREGRAGISGMPGQFGRVFPLRLDGEVTNWQYRGWWVVGAFSVRGTGAGAGRERQRESAWPWRGGERRRGAMEERRG